MAADFLLDLAGDNAVEEALSIEDRVALLRARWVRLEPAVPRGHDLRVLAPVARGAALEEEVTERAPGRGDLELCEQREQAVDHECVLALAGLAVGLDAAVERSPDQFEVEAEREDAAVERRHRTALTRNMLLSSRSTIWSASRSSSGSQRFRTRGSCRGATRSTQISGPRNTPWIVTCEKPASSNCRRRRCDVVKNCFRRVRRPKGTAKPIRLTSAKPFKLNSGAAVVRHSPPGRSTRAISSIDGRGSGR